MNIQNISQLCLVEFANEEITVRGHLFARGNYVDGGQCWLAADRCERNSPSSWIDLGPDRLFEKLLAELDIRAGGEFCLSETVRLVGIAQPIIGSDKSKINVTSLVAETRFGEIVVTDI